VYLPSLPANSTHNIALVENEQVLSRPYLDELNFHDRVERNIIEPMLAWLCAGQKLLDSAQSQFATYQLRRTLERDAGEYGPFLSREDRDVLQQLLDPQSHHSVLNRTDRHIRYGLSVYVGEKP
jgi:hypothetical protein